MTRRRAVAPGQGDLFAAASAGSLFPVRRPAERDRPVDVLRIKTAMGQALKASPDTAEVVAAKIAAMTGEEMSVDALYTYTAPGKTDRTMSIARFVAFVRITGAFWLWDLLVEDDGLTVLEGREAKLAELGHLQQEHQRIGEALKQLRRELGDEPVAPLGVRRRPGGGR